MQLRPGLAQMADIWLTLLKKYSIMAKDLAAEHHNPVTWANTSCDKVRTMLRHVVALKCSGSRFVSEELQTILDMVGSRFVSEELQGPQSDAVPPRVLKTQPSAASSTGSVEICGARCQCPECWQVPMLEVCSDAEEHFPPNDADSDVEVVAAKEPPTEKAQAGEEETKLCEQWHHRDLPKEPTNTGMH